LAYFKEVDKHAFTFTHCCLKLKYYEKWKASFKLWYKDRKRTSKDNEQETPGKGRAYADRPRGHKESKTDLRSRSLLERKKQVPRGMNKGVGTRRSICKASPTYKGRPLKSNNGSLILRR
jgi:hypothetical protein